MELRSRWTNDSSTKANRALKLGLMSNLTENLPIESPLGQLVDLRGIELTEIIKERTLEYIDFSSINTVAPGQFVFCKVRACLFNQGTLSTNLGDNFDRCRFIQCNLRRACIRGRFTECDFTNAVFSNALGNEVVFSKCIFKNCNFKGANLYNCTFENCTVRDCKFGKGSFAGSKFSGVDPHSINFEDTIVDRVEFT